MGTLPSRVFNNGNSQAVRIPAEFRLDTDRVSITRNDAGDLAIHPLRVQRGTALMQALKALGEVDDDFVAALEAEQETPLPVQEREALGDLPARHQYPDLPDQEPAARHRAAHRRTPRKRHPVHCLL